MKREKLLKPKCKFIKATKKFLNQETLHSLFVIENVSKCIIFPENTDILQNLKNFLLSKWTISCSSMSIAKKRQENDEQHKIRENLRIWIETNQNPKKSKIVYQNLTLQLTVETKMPENFLLLQYVHNRNHSEVHNFS